MFARFLRFTDSGDVDVNPILSLLSTFVVALLTLESHTGVVELPPESSSI